MSGRRRPPRIALGVRRNVSPRARGDVCRTGSGRKRGRRRFYRAAAALWSPSRDRLEPRRSRLPQSIALRPTRSSASALIEAVRRGPSQSAPVTEFDNTARSGRGKRRRPPPTASQWPQHPRTETNARIALDYTAIFSATRGVGRCELFDLGGDSLTSSQLMTGQRSDSAASSLRAFSKSRRSTGLACAVDAQVAERTRALPAGPSADVDGRRLRSPSRQERFGSWTTHPVPSPIDVPAQDTLAGESRLRGFAALLRRPSSRATKS